MVPAIPADATDADTLVTRHRDGHGIHHIGIGARLEAHREVVAWPQVVVIEERQVPAETEANALVVRSRLLAGIRREIDEADALIREGPHNRFGIVRARIADDDELPIGVRLRYHSLDRARE